jgi:3-oxoadipate enol-lactonase
MSYLNIKERQIYYDVTGKGKPILILNGIMMSTKSWEPFMSALTKDNTIIRLDFFDQGQSEKLENQTYTQEIQVEVIQSLLTHLKINQISVVGISYGGEVAILFAAKYPKIVDRLVLFNTTPYTSPWLTEIGKQWKSIGKTRDGQTYYQATIPVIYSPNFYESKLDWMKKRESYLLPIFSNPLFLDQMDRLITSAESYDARLVLKDIEATTLIVSGDQDYLTPIHNQMELKDSIKLADMIILPGVGHASMYEKPLLFITIVLGFINALETEYSI